MRKRTLLIGGVAAVTLLAGGWAAAQPAGHGPGSFGPGETMGMHGRMGPGMRGQMGPGMRGQMGSGMHGQMGSGMHGQRGSGMHGQMGPGMHGRMGRGMMGMGSGMMGMHGGTATAGEHSDIHTLFSDHDRIKRTVTNLPDGIRTVTESDDPQLAEVIKRHVAEMGKRVEEGRDPGLPIETPALHAIFRHKGKIKSTYEVIEKGVIVVQTSTDAAAVTALQQHAAEVSDLARRGMIAAHEAMMRNHGAMMGRGMRSDAAEPQHRH
jgi:hypothetical protein